MVWVGLAVTLLTALVATFSEVKYHKGVKPWSGRFYYENRFKVAAGAFAVLGFITSTLTVVDDHAKSEQTESHLRLENNELKGLMLEGREISPVATIIIDTSPGAKWTDDPNEESRWKESSAAAEGPRSLGFVPSVARQQLFEGAKADTVLNRLGGVDILTAPQVGFHFAVLESGATINDSITLPPRYVRTRMHHGDPSGAIAFDISVGSKVDALELFYALSRMYGHKEEFPLAVTAYTTRCQKSRNRRARVSISLNEKRQLFVTARLQEEHPLCDSDGHTVYRWQFAEPPEVAVTFPGGSY